MNETKYTGWEYGSILLMKKPRLPGVFLLLLLTVFSGFTLQAETAGEVLSNAHILGEHQSIVMKVLMDIEKSGNSTERKLEIYLEHENTGAARVLTQIVSPAFLRNMKFLLRRGDDGSEDKWLKTSKGIRRLSNANAAESIFNSDFTVEDFSFVNVSDYRLRFLEDADENEYRIEAVPKAGGENGKKIFNMRPSDEDNHRRRLPGCGRECGQALHA